MAGRGGRRAYGGETPATNFAVSAVSSVAALEPI
jgi:hypothetical protein